MLARWTLAILIALGLCGGLDLRAAPQETPADFERGDANSDGFLDWSEYGSLQGDQSPQTRRDFFDFDENGDGKVDPREFAVPEDERRPHLRSRFQGLDVDEDGKISPDEYIQPHREKPWLSAAEFEAQQFDLDQNGSLSLKEFALTPHGDQFFEHLPTALDQNGDGSLSMDEYVQPRPEEIQFVAAARFLQRDADQDGLLSPEELRNGDVGRVPDPIAELAAEKWNGFQAILNAHDADASGDWIQDEWPTVSESQDVGLCGEQPFSKWDLDGDSRVSVEEAQRVVLASYGCVLRDGTSLRTDDGRVINLNHFDDLDANGDRAVTLQEYFHTDSTTPQHEQAFAIWDADHSGGLTTAELIAIREFYVDTVEDFCRIDVNFDGRLTREELEAVSMYSYESAVRATDAFDRDGDGMLSLREYRLTPLANPVVQVDHVRQDRDLDGMLSWNEYLPATAEWGRDLSWQMFAAFDLDDDRRLAFWEFPCEIDWNRLPCEVALNVLDRNRDGRVQQDDLLALRIPQRKSAPNLVVQQESQMLIEDSFLEADRDGDGRLTCEEFRSSQPLIASAILGSRYAVTPVAQTAAAPAEGADVSTAAPASIHWKYVLMIIGNLVLIVFAAWWLMRPRRNQTTSTKP